MRRNSQLALRNKDSTGASVSSPSSSTRQDLGRNRSGHVTTPDTAAWIDSGAINDPGRGAGEDHEIPVALIDAVKDYQINRGSLIKLVRTEEEATILARPIGASLHPLAFPRRSFNLACRLQPLYNELYAAVSTDLRWLEEALQPLLLKTNSFASKLWTIHLEVMREGGYVQEMSLGIHRSDYMLHENPQHPQDGVTLKQVEFNTFSCAGIAHSSRVSSMHRFLCKSGAYQNLEDEIALPEMPINNSVDQVVDALAHAHTEYIRQRRGSGASMLRTVAVLMVVQPFNVNVADERPFEYGLWDADVPCYHALWGHELLQRTVLTPDKELLFYPVGHSTKAAPVEISVVYHRAGYEEEEYDTTAGIDCRLRIEKSRAIKCPSVLGHLAGFKMVQQALASPGALLRFLSPDKASLIVDSFAPMYPLDINSSRGQRGREIALDPELAANHVLKPSLEGGGHNIYGADIPGFLTSFPQEQWETLILMERIHPPDTTHVMIGPRGLHAGSVETELGIVGACLWRNHPSGDQSPNGPLAFNKQAGFTLKTKAKGIDEMSVIKGYGCFDSPLLKDD